MATDTGDSRIVDKVPERCLVEPNSIPVVVRGGDDDAGEQERTERYSKRRAEVNTTKLTW